VKLDVHYQRKQENIVLSSTVYIIMIKLEVKYLPQIYKATFLCSVTSVGPPGQELRQDGLAEYRTSTETSL
jgi:hypothetical protein